MNLIIVFRSRKTFGLRYLFIPCWR